MRLLLLSLVLSGCDTIVDGPFQTRFLEFTMERNADEQVILTVLMEVNEDDVNQVFGTARFYDGDVSVAEVSQPLAVKRAYELATEFSHPATRYVPICLDFNYVGFDDRSDDEFFEYVGCIE